jgi:2,4-dienoyl-CoA reductase-like NADH-dependent reductase (Old Yellow Enzyme family)/thioredoxin reductase
MGQKIFEPLKIKGMEIKNRIGFAPLLNMPRSAEDGGVGDNTIRWFEARAKGGAGFITTGTVATNAFEWEMIGKPYNIGIAFFDDQFVPGWKRLTDAVHSHGAKIGIQIGASGPMLGVGPSPAPYPDQLHQKQSYFDVMSPIPIPIMEATIEMIEMTKTDLATAAARAKAAGFDYVELHCAHGGATLHCSFISPFYNRRTDNYGGSWEKRLRFPVETVKKMRAAVGDDFPIFARMDGDELLGSRGITLSDAANIIAPALEAAGVDCLDVTQGSIVHSPQGIMVPMYYPRGCFIQNAEAVKKAVKIPVIGVGRITDLDMAEKFLEEGKADLIYLGRQLTADPDTVRKYQAGRPEDIRQCTGCLHQITGQCGRPCAVNYDIQDDPIPLTPAAKVKNVVVVGAGVAGMEAARVAAERGHQVTLMEKDTQLGGIVQALSQDAMTAEFGNFIDYLGTQMKKLAVDVKLGREATVDSVKALKPDAVILAAGSQDEIPDVAKGKPGVMTHIAALRRQREIGRKVVIWGLVGAEFAITLAEAGKEVVLIGRGGEETLAKWDPPHRRYYLLKKLSDINVVRTTTETRRISNPEVLYYTTVEAVGPDGVAVRSKDGAKRTIPYDTLIVSLKRTSNNSLIDQLKKTVPEVHAIGDCREVSDIQRAVWSANEVARTI